jgi:hypothetical protein
MNAHGTIISRERKFELLRISALTYIAMGGVCRHTNRWNIRVTRAIGSGSINVI